MEVRTSCPKCGTRDAAALRLLREHTSLPNGCGEATFSAQGDSDLQKLEAIFPRNDDGRELAFEWVDDRRVRIFRRSTDNVSESPTSRSRTRLESMSREDLLTRAAEMGIKDLPNGSTKAHLAKLIIEATDAVAAA